jgi:hypothetical protein
MGYACRSYLKMPLSSDHRHGIGLDRQFSETDFSIVISHIGSTDAGIVHPYGWDAHWRLSHRIPSPGRKFWAPRIIGNRSLSQLPQYSGRGASMHRLIWIATRGLMEILGLDPYQSETQYLQTKFGVPANRKYSGNLFPLCFLFISTFCHPSTKSGNLAEIFFHSCFHFRIVHHQWRQ